MKPLFITISTATAEHICRILETPGITRDTTACIIGAEIRGLIAADIEEPEPDVDPDETEIEEPEPDGDPDEIDAEFEQGQANWEAAQCRGYF